MRLDPADWPPADHAAWLAAGQAGGPLDPSGLASRWTHKTANTVRCRYGLWIAWLQDNGRLHADLWPGQRVTRETLSDYIAWLRSRKLSPVTIAGYVRDLHEAIRVMCPGADLMQLAHAVQRLEAVAHPVRHKAVAVVSPTCLIDAGTALMQCYRPTRENRMNRRVAGRYRDGLAVTLLAYRPLRLANLTAIEPGRHLEKRGTLYWCQFTAQETKNRQPLAFPLPAALSPWLDLYLSVWRPLLLRGQASNRLWISIRATPMTDNTMYCRISHVTQEALGRAINPHLFRDCAATFIAEQAPEQIRIVARILGHDTLRSSEAHYNQAGMLSAQNTYLDALTRLRD